MRSLSFGAVLLLLATQAALTRAKKKDPCSVCRAIVLEAEDVIGSVDPKKTIESGSYRVDPKGNQKLQTKLYARSNTHLEEVMQSVCRQMNKYAYVIQENGSKQLVKVDGYGRPETDSRGLKIDHEPRSSFIYQCDHFMEDHEEDLISYLQTENIPDYEKHICGEKIGVCSNEQLALPVETIQGKNNDVSIDSEDEPEVDGDEEEDDDDDDSEDNDNDEKDEL